MKKNVKYLIIAMFTLLIGCNIEDSNPVVIYEETVVVANRGAGSISFINTQTNSVINTLSISGSEPMYVVYVPKQDRIYIGDRANHKVHIVNPHSKQVEGAVSVGNGVFHMWADGLGKQLWVNNDMDNTISVIDLQTRTVVTTINVGMKPHDVFLTSDGSKAYVSVFNNDTSMPDKIFMYNTSNFMKTGEVSVGKDPHLFHLPSSNKLIVPCQSGEVYQLNGNDLSVLNSQSFTGAHGIFASPDQQNVYVTNITGGQLYSIETSNNMLQGSVINTLSGTPHNIVINKEGTKAFITHSGASASTVSTYSIINGNITTGTTITVGTNPFGLAYYKREVK